jgi:hypothetical protein
LCDALQTRNWLTHHYFWDRAGKFVTPTGREEMMQELELLREQLEEFDAYFDRIAQAWAERHGITKEMIDHYKKVLTEAP